MSTDAAAESTCCSSNQGCPAPPPEGSPCWIEIPAVDIEKCKTFYSSLFPSWSFSPPPSSHGTYDPTQIIMYSFPQPRGIMGGGIIKMDPSCKAEVQKNGVGMTVSYFVKSIDKTTERVKELGGEAVLPKTEENKNGWYAKYRDVEGNIFGVYEVRMNKDE